MPSSRRWQEAEPLAPRLTRGRIDPAEVLRWVARPGAGAVVLFLGSVRDTGRVGEVEGMEYEAYSPMAEKRIAMAEEEVKRLWPATTGVRVVHRLGMLAVGDVSVAVAVSSPHREEAFEACRHAMEMVKHQVPIWKREKLAGGGEAWVGGTPLGAQAARRPRRARA